METNRSNKAALFAALVAASSMNMGTPAVPPPKPRSATQYEQQQDRKRRQRANDRLRSTRRDPELNRSVIEAAVMKREQRADRNRLNFEKMNANYYRGAWQPKPAHNKPTYKEIRAAQAGGA